MDREKEIFFDGVVADWLVQSKISDARRQFAYISEPATQEEAMEKCLQTIAYFIITRTLSRWTES